MPKLLLIKKYVRCSKTHRTTRTLTCQNCPHFEKEHGSYIECSYSPIKQPVKCPICKRPVYCKTCGLEEKYIEGEQPIKIIEDELVSK